MFLLKKTVRRNNAAFMSKELRKVIYTRNCFINPVKKNIGF